MHMHPTVFLAQQLHSAPGVMPLRSQEQTDTWAIHQLYNSAVPKQVQFADAFTSHRWDVRVGSPAGNIVTRGWLAEDGHQLLGYVRISSHGATHVLELIYAPDRHQIVPDLLDGVIARLRSLTRVDRVYCALRGYQAEAVSALAERGFVPARQTGRWNRVVSCRLAVGSCQFPAGEWENSNQKSQIENSPVIVNALATDNCQPTTIVWYLVPDPARPAPFPHGAGSYRGAFVEQYAESSDRFV